MEMVYCCIIGWIMVMEMVYCCITGWVWNSITLEYWTLSCSWSNVAVCPCYRNNGLPAFRHVDKLPADVSSAAASLKTSARSDLLGNK